jgi:hypothetical protein
VKKGTMMKSAAITIKGHGERRRSGARCASSGFGAGLELWPLSDICEIKIGYRRSRIAITTDKFGKASNFVVFPCPCLPARISVYL